MVQAASNRSCPKPQSEFPAFRTFRATKCQLARWRILSILHGAGVSQLGEPHLAPLHVLLPRLTSGRELRRPREGRRDREKGWGESILGTSSLKVALKWDERTKPPGEKAASPTPTLHAFPQISRLASQIRLRPLTLVLQHAHGDIAALILHQHRVKPRGLMLMLPMAC